jgi:putative FmdB family regulatory protein
MKGAQILFAVLFRLEFPLPLYEYQCSQCNHRFERIRKFSDPPLTTCPECGGVVVQLLSAPAVQFKGSGWYVTDYARKGTSPSTAQSSGNGGGEKKAETKSESPKAEK